MSRISIWLIFQCHVDNLNWGIERLRREKAGGRPIGRNEADFVEANRSSCECLIRVSFNELMGI
jgi:hypothetical protein